MRKKALVLLLMFIAVLAILCLTACNDGIALEAPSGVKYDPDRKVISWNAVEHAGGYKIQINDGGTYPVTGTTYPYTATEGTFTVTVSAQSEISDYLPSKETTKTFSALDTINAINVDEQGQISWGAVENANGYLLKINGTVLPETLSTPYYSGLPEGSNSVMVKPVVGNTDEWYAYWSPTKRVDIIQQISKDSIKYSGGEISWRGSVGTQNYEVYINEKLEKTVTGTTVAYDSLSKNFSVRIKAIGDHNITFDSAISEEKRFIYLNTVTNISVVDGILTWNEIVDADGYKVKINNREETVTDCQYTTLSTNVTTDVQIMAINSDDSYFSDWSAVKSVFVLKSPVLQWNDSLEIDEEEKNSIYWDGVSNAAGYTVKTITPDGKENLNIIGSSDRSYANAYQDIGTYTISIKSNAAADQGNVFDSVYSQPIIVKRLAAPKQVAENFITSNKSNIEDGFRVTFEKVAEATQYKLYQDRNEIMAGTTNQFSVGDLLEPGTVDEQMYNYSIQSIGKVDRTGGKIVVTLNSVFKASLSFKITVLPTPTNPGISGYSYSYGSVSKSTGYSVSIGGNKFNSVNNSYDLSGLNAGNYSVSVCACGNGADVLPSAYTHAINVNRLSAPTGVQIGTAKGSEGILSFQGVSNAASYSVVFNNNNVQIPVDDIDNMNQHITERGTTVYMLSIANVYSQADSVYYMTSQPSETYTFTKLAKPTFGDVAFSNTQLIWKAPVNINTSVYTPTYEVYDDQGYLYNGEKNGTTMDISYLAGGSSYKFVVKAIGNGTNYINSEMSTQVEIYKLATPDVDRTKEGQYSWQSVEDATSYSVYIDNVFKGTFSHEALRTYQFTPDFMEIKTYSVSVVAKGDNGLTTIDSQPCIITQIVKQLAEPLFEISYSHECFDVDGTIDVTITKESQYASGYSYTIGDAKFDSNETSCSRNPSSPGTFKVSVYAIGGLFDEAGNYYINSQRHGGDSASSITILAAPNSAEIKLSQDGVLTWPSVAGTAQYIVTLKIDNAIVLDKVTIQNTRYTITDFNSVKDKKIEVTVQAKGNGQKTISSAESSKSWGSD